jgi:hypothetical protein
MPSPLESTAPPRRFLVLTAGVWLTWWAQVAWQYDFHPEPLAMPLLA